MSGSLEVRAARGHLGCTVVVVGMVGGEPRKCARGALTTLPANRYVTVRRPGNELFGFDSVANAQCTS